MADQAATAILGPYPTLQPAADVLDVALIAGTGSDQTLGPLNPGDILVAYNKNVGAQTLTITSQTDRHQRSGNITTYSIGIDEMIALKFDQTEGWVDSSRELHVTAEGADVLMGIIRPR